MDCNIRWIVAWILSIIIAPKMWELLNRERKPKKR